MLPPTSFELTQEQIEELEKARKLIPTLKTQLRRAKAAGIDVTAQEDELATLETQLEKLYRVYVRRISPTPTST